MLAKLQILHDSLTVTHDRIYSNVLAGVSAHTFKKLLVVIEASGSIIEMALVAAFDWESKGIRLNVTRSKHTQLRQIGRIKLVSPSLALLIE